MAFCASVSTPISSGVRNTPSRLDSEALHTAAGTLPPAIEVKAIDDCTVDGSVHRNSTPMYRSGVSSQCDSGLNSRPSSGNRMKVAAKMVRCRRQCNAPATMASRDSRAPCRKNSAAIARSVTTSITDAARPCTGSSEASSTVHSSARVKGSMRRRASQDLIIGEGRAGESCILGSLAPARESGRTA
ncbi:hypothetical protein NB689_002825 [Xanthomonas sacchari]|nr:hypothetical protein [Xanthomonas sacchari]